MEALDAAAQREELGAGTSFVPPPDVDERIAKREVAEDAYAKIAGVPGVVEVEVNATRRPYVVVSARSRSWSSMPRSRNCRVP